MSSNMSFLRRVDPPDPVEPPVDPPEEPEVPLLDEVEYLLVLEEDSWVSTVVPNPWQFSQSSSSAPSTFVVVSDVSSAPHISHWGILTANVRPGINHTPST